jgi:hypothetical protein
MKLETSASNGAEQAPSPLEFRRLARLEDLAPVSGRRVLVRADFNVPLRATPRRFGSSPWHS